MKKRLILMALVCLTLVFGLSTPVLAEAYTESADLADFLTKWELTVGDTVFSSDTVTANTVIEYQEGMNYSLEFEFRRKTGVGLCFHGD